MDHSLHPAYPHKATTTVRASEQEIAPICVIWGGGWFGGDDELSGIQNGCIWREQLPKRKDKLV